MLLKPKEKGRKSLKQLRNELDKIFSLYIRYRDSFERSGTTIGRCCTCPRVLPIKQMDCGHFQGRKNDNTRWVEENAHLQCKSCNGFYGGKAWTMGKYIDQKYGSGTADMLEAKAKMNIRYDRVQIEAMIVKYKEKYEELIGPY